MKKYQLVRCALKVMASVSLGVFLSACGSSDSSTVPDVGTDPSFGDEPVVSSLPIFTETSKGVQSFVLKEDSILKGRFYTSVLDDESRVTILSLPAHGLLEQTDDGSQIFVYTPQENYWGSDTFAYATANGLSLTVTLLVEAVNDAPKLFAEIPHVAAQGQLFTHELEVTDVDDDELRFEASGLPSWLEMDAENGVLSGLPTQYDIGISDEVTVRVTDSGGLSDEVAGIYFEVLDINDAPTLNLSQMPTELKARETVTVRVYPDDADGDQVSLEVEENAIVTGSANDGAITLIASDVNEVLDVNVVIKATDQHGSVSREIVPIRVLPLTESGRGMTLSGIKNGRAIHVVVLGDGYTSDQQRLFREHVEQMIDEIRSDEGIEKHLDALSIHMIATISEESGSDDNQDTDARNTYYGSYYNCDGIRRLICASSTMMLTTAFDEYPDTDQVILLVNRDEYGGSGNNGARYAITSAYHPYIALHELGHSQANLADEYGSDSEIEAGSFASFVEGKYANVTALTDPELVPWAHWIDFDQALPQLPNITGVGLFEGGLYQNTGVYRPTYNSRMRSNHVPFGPVNSERWILSLYEDTDGGIRGFSPIAETLELTAGESQTFVVSPIFGPGIQDVEWEVDGEVIEPAADPNSLTLTLSTGIHQVELTVRDVSGSIRKPEPHPGIFTWSWTVEVQ